MDITQVWVKFKMFERTLAWNEYWHGRDNTETEKIPIFNLHKINMPKNFSVPEGLNTFISSVRSELQNHRNRNSAECNLSPKELVALRKLQQLHKQIVICACDKGAGKIILDFEEYLRACYKHLTSELSPGQP